MGEDNQHLPRIEDLPTFQIVEIEVPNRLEKLEELMPFDPSVLDEDRRYRDDWRWN
jgi:hypothetical protein